MRKFKLLFLSEAIELDESNTEIEEKNDCELEDTDQANRNRSS